MLQSPSKIIRTVIEWLPVTVQRVMLDRRAWAYKRICYKRMNASRNLIAPLTEAKNYMMIWITLSKKLVDRLANVCGFPGTGAPDVPEAGHFIGWSN